MTDEKKEGTIYIGNKDMAVYVLAVKRGFEKGEKELTLESMGRTNAKLLDLVEVLKKRENVQIQEIRTDTTIKPVHDEGKDPYDRRITTLAVKIKQGK